MNSFRLMPLACSIVLACAPLCGLRAADPTNTTAATATAADATQKSIDKKSSRLLAAIQINDVARSARVKGILDEWLAKVVAWHAENDPKLKDLWSQWSKARAVLPKDEFPGEVIAHKIADAYATLQPAYQTFTNKLSAELTPEQIDTIKETWSRSPGMKRTYNAYLEIAPGLNDDQKKVIYDRMCRAREDAMFTDSDKEIVNIFKCHKVKVEQYIGSIEWEKLHKAFANRGKKENTGAQ